MNNIIISHEYYPGKYLGVVANEPDFNIVVSKFELQSRYYVDFWTNTFDKRMKPRIPYTVLIG